MATNEGEFIPKSRRTSLVIQRELLPKLKSLKRELGFSSYSGLLNYATLELSRGELIPPAHYDVIFDKLGTAPGLITGASGAGKTTTLKFLLTQYISQNVDGCAFVLDVSNEYEDHTRLDLGKFFSLHWERPGQKVRFVPNSNVEISKAEAASLFSHLNFVKNSGVLKNWVLVVEEGHRFQNDPNLRALLIEARKFVRKMILVTTDWRVYEGIARVFKPPVRSEEI